MKRVLVAHRHHKLGLATVHKQPRLCESRDDSRQTGSRRMTRMKTLACSVCLVLVGVAPVAADNDAPKSLRMRAKKAPGSHWTPMRWAKRVAQAQPAPDQPAPDPSAAAQPAPEPGA